MSEKKMINLEVDGKAVQVPEGSMVMEGPAGVTEQGPRGSGDASKTSAAGRRRWVSSRGAAR